MTRRRWLVLVVAAAAVLLLAGREGAHAYVEYTWFASLGAADVWKERTAAVLELRLVSGLIATLFVFANLYAVRRSVVSLVLPRRIANLEISEELSSSYLTVGVIAASLLFGALLSYPLDDWSSLVLARHGLPFNESDPYFGADLGFFVYWLPLESALQMWALIALLLVAAIVLFLYALTPNLKWERGAIYVSSHVRRHVTILAGAFLLLLAWNYRLAMYRVLSHGSGIEGSFGYVDHVVNIPGALVLSLVALGGALVVGWSGWTGQLRIAMGAIGTVALLAILIRGIAPWVASRPPESAESQLREQPYLSARASYTRRAFGADRVMHAPSGFGYQSLGSAAQWVSSWDAPALAALVGVEPDDDEPTPIGWRATENGLIADVPVPPATDLDTHPWRLARAEVWRAQPRVPSVGTDTSVDRAVAPPTVYPGAGSVTVVDDTTERLVGPRLSSMLARLAFAWSFQRPGLLFSEVPPGATVLLHRDVRARVRALMPFFAQSAQITPIVSGDTIYWSMDLYSASSSYPLTRELQVAGDTRSYFQHAATTVINGTTGRIITVPDSVLDPIASTWFHRYPSLFATWRAVPAAVRAALPPEVDMLSAQAAAFGRYGTRMDHDVPRDVPALDGADSGLTANDPPFALAGGQTASAIPLVTRDGDQYRGAVVATGGETRITIWLAATPGDRRWTAMLDRLRNGEPAHRGGVARGRARVVPLATTTALVQSTYAWKPPGTPALAHVNALVGDTLISVSALDALAASPNATATAPQTARDFSATVDALYREMRSALARGDWTRFGAAFDSLGKVIPNRPH